jgi:hypothetical protein
MKMSNRFDRVSTEEELHQVLDVLGDLERGGWTLPGNDSATPTSGLWADVLFGGSPSDESLAALIVNKPELKN